MKKLLLLAAICFAANSAFSQSFTHGVGVTTIVDKVKDLDARVGGGFTYSPRFNFAETERTSVSVGIPINVAISSSYASSYTLENDAYSDGASVAVLLNAPVMVNFNFGAGSSRNNESRLGGFVGAGFGIHWSASTDEMYYDDQGNLQYRSTGGTDFGPSANAGLRIAVGNKGKNVEVKLSYFKGLNENELNLFSLAGIFNF